MKSNPEKTDKLMQHFDKWLQTEAVRPKADFTARIKERIQKEDADLDYLVDRLLKPDHSLGDPFMAARVRREIEKSEAEASRTPWFQWVTPLAAAAVLGFAFFSFQLKAPYSGNLTQNGPSPVAVQMEGTSPDSELTQIFALASNLEASTDLSRLQSTENFAFLLE